MASSFNFDFPTGDATNFLIGQETVTVYEKFKLAAVTTFDGRDFRSITEVEVDASNRYAINNWSVGSGSDDTISTTIAPSTTATDGGTTTIAPDGGTTTVAGWLHNHHLHHHDHSPKQSDHFDSDDNSGHDHDHLDDHDDPCRRTSHIITAPRLVPVGPEMWATAATGLRSTATFRRSTITQRPLRRRSRSYRGQE